MLIFQTQAVTDSKTWQKLDRSRTVDAKSGILPPKVARMMLNLVQITQTDSLTILDPFCGTGGILTQALILRNNCIGIDNDLKAIAISKFNLENINTENQYSLIHGDSTKIGSDKLTPSSIDAIVTEGYLGPSHPVSQEEFPDLLKQLADLHLKALHNLQPYLKPNAQVVIALPKYNHPASVKSLSNLIDTCENRGYTRLAGPLLYSQPSARVKRAIYILKNNSTSHVKS